jgi:predicted protein tyrosine phosphatase
MTTKTAASRQAAPLYFYNDSTNFLVCSSIDTLIEHASISDTQLLSILIIKDPSANKQPPQFLQNVKGIEICQVEYCDLEKQGGWAPNKHAVTTAWDFIAESMANGRNIVICSPGGNSRACAYLLAAIMKDTENPAASVKKLLELYPSAAPNLRTLSVLDTQCLSNQLITACLKNKKMLSNLSLAAEIRRTWLKSQAPQHKALRSQNTIAAVVHPKLQRFCRYDDKMIAAGLVVRTASMWEPVNRRGAIAVMSKRALAQTR